MLQLHAGMDSHVVQQGAAVPVDVRRLVARRCVDVKPRRHLHRAFDRQGADSLLQGRRQGGQERAVRHQRITVQMHQVGLEASARPQLHDPPIDAHRGRLVARA